jgi:mono/diheme cytochrome c family protein
MRSLARIVAILGMAAAVASCRRASAVAKPGPAAPVETYELRLGRGVYRHYCQTCHGETGAGDGFNAYNLDPRPRDLGDPAFLKKKSESEMADAIRRGGAGVGLSPLMPPWGRTLSERQIGNVTRYIRTFRRAG